MGRNRDNPPRDKRLQARLEAEKSAPKPVNIDREREKQLKESMEIINQLLNSDNRPNVIESMREILRNRR